MLCLSYFLAGIRSRGCSDRACVYHNQVRSLSGVDDRVPGRPEFTRQVLNFRLVEPATDGIKKYFHRYC
jgi:hypothetical protein